MTRGVFVFLSLIICLLCCKIQPKKENEFDVHTQYMLQVIDSLSVEYIDFLKSDSSIGDPDTCYVNVVEREWYGGKELVFDMFLFTRPEIGSKPPVYFNVLKPRGGFEVVFLYSHTLPYDSLSIVSSLKEKNLLASQPFESYFMNDFLSWTVFFCKNDTRYFKVVRSDGVIILDKYNYPCI